MIDRRRGDRVDALRFEALLLASGDVYLETDAHGLITFLAGSIEEHFGNPHDELLGTSVFDLLQSSDGERARGLWEERVSTAARLPADDFWIERPVGTWSCLSLTVHDRSDDPSSSRVAVTGHDVTLRRNLAQARTVISGANSAIVHATSESELLDEICRVVVNDVTYHLAWVGLADPTTALGVRMVAFADHSAAYLDALEHLAGSERYRGPLLAALESHEVGIIQDIAALPETMARWRQLALDHGYRSMIALPLPFTQDDFGVLAIYSEQINVFTEAAIAMLMELATDLAFGVEALRTRAQRSRYRVRFEESLEAVVQAIAAAAELRDPYTAGHQRGVARLGVAIAEGLGLDGDLVAGIGIAGSIHDIGKLAIPAEILSKPGALSAAEFALIKEHSQAGYAIVARIDFPAPVAEMILQHHERLDGSGYPNGLRDDAIGIGARILAVADTIEAIHAHRPYRPGLGINAALQAVNDGRTVLFDAEVVDVCTRLFTQHQFEFTS